MSAPTETLPIPGHASADLLARMQRVVPRAIASVHLPAAIAFGRGAMFEDVDRNRYIDLAGGLGCLNVGHSHPAVVQAIQQAATKFTHTDFSVVPYDSYIALAERLARLAPGRSDKKVAFFNSGAEAVENAIKIARAYTGRQAVVALDGAFHGRTLMALSLTSRTTPYKKGFGPFAPEVYRVGAPYCFRCPWGQEPSGCGHECAAAVEQAFRTRVAAEDVAAVIVEPVMGEGGFVPMPTQYLQALADLCKRHGILLIIDEIQTGMGRTGRMFATEHYGIEPDLLLAGKSLAAGLPLSAVIGRGEIMDTPQPGALGGTYPGNPIACAAALAVLDVIEGENLLDRSMQIGERLRSTFARWVAQYPVVGEERGLGAMRGIELVRPDGSPDPVAAERIVKWCLERGVLVVKCGIYGNVIRILCPLVITDEQLDQALGVMEDAVAAVSL